MILFSNNDDILVSRDRGCSGRDRMVVGFTATCAISAYKH